MTSHVTPRTIVAVTSLALALGFSLIGLYQAWDAREATREALQELSSNQQLAQKILRLRNAPDRARAATRAFQELSKTLETAAQTASIAPEQILSIQPRAPQRMGETAYEAHPTDVELDGVRLAQIVALAQSLSQAGEGLILRTLRLSPARSRENPEADECWHAELTLTYLVYSPKSSRGPTRKSKSASESLSGGA